MITGVRTFARLRSRHTSNPSFDGSITSRRMRSHAPSRARLLASSPSLDTSTSYPSSRRSSCSPRAISGSSSTMRMRAISGVCRQNDCEGATGARHAVDVDAPAMRLDDFVDGRQPDARALDAARSRLLTAVELREYLIAFVPRDADAVVANGNQHVAVAALHADVDARRLRRIFDGIIQEIPDGGRQGLFVAVDGR